MIPPDEIVALAGMLTGVLVMGALSWGLVRIFQGPVGQALARKITGKIAEQEAELVSEVLEMRHQLDQLRHRLGETEERLDFNERLLVHRNESPAEKPS